MTWSPLAWGFLSGRYRKGQPVDMSTGRPALAPHRFDPSLPVTAAKLDAVEQLIELAAGLGRSLPELAVAFPIAHPAVTSVIIGPRTMNQLDGMLKGASLALDDAERPNRATRAFGRAAFPAARSLRRMSFGPWSTHCRFASVWPRLATSGTSVRVVRTCVDEHNARRRGESNVAYEVIALGSR